MRDDQIIEQISQGFFNMRVTEERLQMIMRKRLAIDAFLVKKIYDFFKERKKKISIACASFIMDQMTNLGRENFFDITPKQFHKIMTELAFVFYMAQKKVEKKINCTF